jgi:hypothetical protein
MLYFGEKLHYFYELNVQYALNLKLEQNSDNYFVLLSKETFVN